MSTSIDQNTGAGQRTLRDPDRTVPGDRETTFVWDLGEDPEGGTRQAILALVHHKHRRAGAFSATLLNRTEEGCEQRMRAITTWARIAAEPVARYSGAQLERFAERALQRLRTMYGQDTDEARHVRGYFEVQS